MHLRDALQLYLGQLAADGRSEHTIGQYRRHVGLLAAWLAAQGHGGLVGDIDHELIAAFLASPQAIQRPDGKPKRPTSANALRSSVRTFFAYIHAAGYTRSNAARLVRRARCGTPPPRAMAEAEWEALRGVLAQCRCAPGERDLALFSLLHGAGLRLGSALGLDVEDLDLDRAEIHVRVAKGSRPETVYMPRVLADHLRAYVGDRRSGPLFCGRDGRRLSPRHVQRRMRQWLARAGIERRASPHSLRHSFAMALYRRTGDVLLVREALRHRSIASTLVYARADGERLRRVLA